MAWSAAATDLPPAIAFSAGFTDDAVLLQAPAKVPLKCRSQQATAYYARPPKRPHPTQYTASFSPRIFTNRALSGVPQASVYGLFSAAHGKIVKITVTVDPVDTAAFVSI